MVHDLSRTTEHSTTCRGASHAFSLATPTKSSPKDAGTNGALAAATIAGTGMSSQRVQLPKEAISNGQKREGFSTKTRRRSGAIENLTNPGGQSSLSAAALHATSKSMSVSTQESLDSTPNSQVQSPLQIFVKNEVIMPATTSRSKDEAVVGNTSSIVSLFESKQTTKKNAPTTHSVRYVTKPTSAIASPTPSKPSIESRPSATKSLFTFPSAPKLGKDSTASGPSRIIDAGAAAAAARSVGQTRAAPTTRLIKTAHPILYPSTMPESPAPRRSKAYAPLDTTPGSGRSSSGISMERTSLASAQAEPWEPSTTPQSFRSDPASLPFKLSPAPPSRPSLTVRSSRSFETKVDLLANTIVAASLASSRAPSPTKPLPPPPRRYKSYSLFHDQHSQGHISRTPSPAKAMRHTMREPLPSDEEVEYKKKGILMRKHPHKHHEGDRRRYRATVTERERRRYDGVWAANKGLWMDTDSSDSVLNLVVRDIWSRSRLPNDVLADIWDLVDIQGGDRLKRNEFVVGMWLIDQRLKGRKLPLTVSESLWNSVRLLHGVKVSQHRH